jgi:leucyl aminopeptidase
MQAVRDLQLPCNVVAAIPLCENGIGCDAYKPGDVYRSRAGKSVEIMSTDAEGRLILADALSYAQDTFSPSRIIDVATLTGAAEIALGKEISAMYSNTDALAYELEQAAAHAGEPVWRMPLYLDYAKQLESDIADCKNLGSRAGGSIYAAIFLHSFLKPVPWAHFDVAGTAFLQEPRRYFKKGATGIPVRTLLEFLIRLGR